MQKGIEEGMFESLPKCETADFLQKEQIREQGSSRVGIEAKN